MTGPVLRRSPLHARHEALGARLTDFGGWEMPLQYAGVVEEHQAVRDAVGLFDVSHLGKASVRGPGARAFVDGCLTNHLGRIGPGQAQYTMCCDDASGGVVDDLIAYLSSDEDLYLVPNAANTAEVVRRLVAAAPDGIAVEDRHEERAVIAVQGPRSADVLAAVGLPADLAYMSFVVADWQGVSTIVCRTGYTGELGFELLPEWDGAERLWDALEPVVREHGGRPCGLGARDTLRLEMGYPLHGQDLSLDITPVQARAGWAVGWRKPRFWGRDVLVAEREAGPRRLLWGLEALERAIPRSHMTVSASSGEQLGEVTSGTFSPTLRRGIALALLDRAVAEGDEVQVDVRGRPAPFRVVKPPFVPSHVKGD